jgi:hypothetical protein
MCVCGYIDACLFIAIMSSSSSSSSRSRVYIIAASQPASAQVPRYFFVLLFLWLLDVLLLSLPSFLYFSFFGFSLIRLVYPVWRRIQ